MTKNLLKVTGLILLIALVALGARWYVADQHDGRIYWAEDRPLSWEDYAGEPDMSVDKHANTFYNLGYRGFMEEGEVQVEVNCYFIKDSSWVKPNHRTDELLQHEQLHFDLAELAARKMRKRYQEVELKPKTANDKILAIYKKQYKKLRKLQRQYDKETKHGIDSAAQKRWNQKVPKMLRKYADYQRDYQAREE